jgi:LuxR family maltose regulon positive regulatory protein
LASGNTYTATTATCRLAYTEMLAGRLRQGVKIYQEALELAVGVEGRYLPVAGYALVYLGMVYLEWNDLEAAARHLEDGIDLCRQVGFLFDQVVGYSTLARARHAQQDWEGVRNALQSAERSSQKMKGYVFARRWVEDCQIRLWSAQGRISEVARWLQVTDLSVDDDVGFVRELEHIILARALLAVGREQPGEPYLDDALALLARLLEAAESAGWKGKVVEILVLQARAFQAKGHTEKALNVLERALDLAEPEGYVRTFVDEGAPMDRLLRQAARSHTAPDYERRLLAALGDTPDHDGLPEAMGAVPSSALVDPLTERELEVLQLIAEGLSNREIADRLVVALSTVKVHTRNIYAKLDVNSRTQAVVKAQRLDLLWLSERGAWHPSWISIAAPKQSPRRRN